MASYAEQQERIRRLLNPIDQEQQRRNEKVQAYLTNPFVRRDGSLANPYINYQGLLDSDQTSDRVKRLITGATGLTQTQKPVQTQQRAAAQTNPTAVTETADGNGAASGNGKVGWISAKYETGGWNPGAVSSGAGDYGGVSYGIPQFSTTTGSAASFVNWLKQNNPEMGSAFGDYKPGTAEFNNAWKSVASKYGDTFGNLQTQYAYDTMVTPFIQRAKETTGVDLSATPALRELAYSTAIQFGGAGTYALGNINPSMSEQEIINTVYDNKMNNYKSYFRSSSANVQESVRNRFANERNDVLSLVGTGDAGQSTGGSGAYANKVGTRVANTGTYRNDAAVGQCVWYVRGRMKEKLGKDTGAIGNANQMYYNAPARTRVAAAAENLRPDMLVSYQYGTSAAGQSAGHVIYIEDVVGDTVYYTEGGSGYYRNGTDGVVKTATRQQIMNGVNSNGARIGSNVVGFVDLNKL